ncbi:hypothetical protein PV325_000352 [Microctonus aethiopoides]|uniref:Galactosylgalactosylxylosylprotein 3-beta-glucuronosyltransferase n=1 Tax=Microctonus aethiopoides TaxID=144406 RepID=A0AA39EVI2_9HYME|nr:hypothetical protein PV325_000352 [Microctonus aethiopoides]KAK0096396.1 hypothetical protein PV326_005597 [Microctonus aethiopoides]KAK0158312.1 hypothetical protein PV328_009330 [Microctonus aethiopoides]
MAVDTESLIGTIEYKNNMRSIWRSPIVPFIILASIITGLYVVYENRTKWQHIEESLNNLINLASEQHELINQLYILNAQTSNSKESVNNNGPIIFAITPTFKRPSQKAELTRLAQTFLHIKNFHWIIVEDSNERTKLVTNFLSESGLIYHHLNVATPRNFKLKKSDPHWKKPRGIAQRNAALTWIRKNYNATTNGIVYFADDDNTYSVKLFKEMEKIKVIGVWPVGLVGGLMVERPICDNVTNKVVGFNSAWKPERIFPIDMAGFALNLKVVIEKKDAMFSYAAPNGYHETTLLEQMVTRDQLEPLADCCTKVYVWHTRTEPPTLRDEQQLIKKGLRSDTNIEV